MYVNKPKSVCPIIPDKLRYVMSKAPLEADIPKSVA